MRVVVMCGETLGRLSRGRVRAPLHYVDERVMGQARISMPFFLRARPDAKLGDEDMTVGQLMEEIVLTNRPWIKLPQEEKRGGSGCWPCPMTFGLRCDEVCGAINQRIKSDY